VNPILELDAKVRLDVIGAAVVHDLDTPA